MAFGTSAPDFPRGCALVFGGSGGLGQAIAGLIAQRGSDVVLTYRSRAFQAGRVVAEIRGHGHGATA